MSIASVVPTMMNNEELNAKYAALINNAIAEGRENQIPMIVRAFEAELHGTKPAVSLLRRLHLVK
jgi:predicted nucleic-acid-binding protein